MDRKAELERKKAKLAAIREEKERRRREKEVKDMEDATTKLVTGQEKDPRFVSRFFTRDLCQFSKLNLQGNNLSIVLKIAIWMRCCRRLALLQCQRYCRLCHRLIR